MNSNTIRILKLLRSVKGDFMRGYAMGAMNAELCNLDAWEQQYLINVSNQIIWRGASA